MDSILQSWLDLTDEAERERVLNEIIQVHAAPLIKQALKLRLDFYLGKDGNNSNNPDAEDLYIDVITKLIQRLQDLRAEPGKNGIGNYRQFVTRVATNACHDYLRAKSPARARLKYNLRNLLERHRDFKFWKGEDQELLCGFTAWESKGYTPHSAGRLRQIEEDVEAFKAAMFPAEDTRSTMIAKVLEGVFEWVGGPVELNRLVDIVAALRETTEQPPESLDEDESYLMRRLADSTPPCDVVLEEREKLEEFWREVRRLPREQRDAFCLSFADADGEDLWSLLLRAQVTTLPQLAAEFSLSVEQAAALWKRLPLKGVALTEQLGATPQQVSRWNGRALKRLQKNLFPHWSKK